MKLEFPLSSLAAALQTVGGAVPARSPKEILRNIKVSVTRDATTFSATDQEVAVVHAVSIDAPSTGEFLLPAKRTTDIVRSLDAETVMVDADKGHVRIAAGGSEFKLQCDDAAEFPPISGMSGVSFRIEASALKRSIRRTVFAADVDSTRYALGGVRIEAVQGAVTFAATDSRRLAVTSATADCEEACAAIVPVKALQLLERSLPDSDDTVECQVEPNHVLFRCGATTVYSRQVEGRFPQWRDVIPTPVHSVEVVAGPLHSAVRQALVMTSEETRGVDFTFSDGVLRLESLSAGAGQSRIEMPISWEHDDLKVSLDARYVADFLRVLDGGDTVSVGLIDGEAAVLFKTQAYQYVVMPLSR